jgi:hypothetical protein
VGAVFACIPLLFNGATANYPVDHIFINEVSYKEFGRYHALDLYTIMATTTDEEWEYALQLRDQFKNDPPAKEAGNLVSKYFSSLERIGMIRFMESPYYPPELQFEDFQSESEGVKWTDHVIRKGKGRAFDPVR